MILFKENDNNKMSKCISHKALNLRLMADANKNGVEKKLEHEKNNECIRRSTQQKRAPNKRLIH